MPGYMDEETLDHLAHGWFVKPRRIYWLLRSITEAIGDEEKLRELLTLFGDAEGVTNAPEA